MPEEITENGVQTDIETPEADSPEVDNQEVETPVDVDPFSVPKTDDPEAEVVDETNQEEKTSKEEEEKGEGEIDPLTVEQLNLPPELLEEMSDYGYDVPIGMKMLNDFIKEKGADPKLAKELAQELYIEKMIKPALEIARNKVDRDVVELREHYGSDERFDEAQTYVQKAFKQAFGADATKVTTALRLGGLGVEPAIFKGFERIGRMLAEDKGNSATDKGKGSGGKIDYKEVYNVPEIK